MELNLYAPVPPHDMQLVYRVCYVTADCTAQHQVTLSTCCHYLAKIQACQSEPLTPSRLSVTACPLHLNSSPSVCNKTTVSTTGRFISSPHTVSALHTLRAVPQDTLWQCATEMSGCMEQRLSLPEEGRLAHGSWSHQHKTLAAGP